MAGGRTAPRIFVIASVLTLHTQTIGSPGGGGLPVPPLGLTIVPPEGIPEPRVTESYGTTTTVNNDAHIRVWVVQIPAEGTYNVNTDGKVNGYINPQLAFGRDSSFGWLAWAFAGLFVVGLLELTASILWAVQARKATRAPVHQPIDVSDSYAIGDPYTPMDDGVRIEQPNNLAALRDSGALTDAEFETEKRRILNG